KERQGEGKLLGIFEVERDALLIAVDGVEERAVAVDVGVGDVEAAADVAGAWALELDHPRAEVGEAQGGRRAREELAHVDNDDPLEGALPRGAPAGSVRGGRLG